MKTVSVVCDFDECETTALWAVRGIEEDGSLGRPCFDVCGNHAHEYFTGVARRLGEVPRLGVDVSEVVS